MEFHPEKCNVLRMTRSRSPSIFNYTLHGTNLKSTESTKYLGVTLTKDLTWGKHIDIIRATANQQLAFVRRNIRTRSSSTKDKLFNTLVRPHLEYAATVWDPHISKQKHSLEMVQRRAARWETNRHHNTSSVTDMLHTLGWTSLEHRRATSRLCMLYQIYHGSIGIPHDPYILPYRHTPRPSRQTDMHTLATYQCRTNYCITLYFRGRKISRKVNLKYFREKIFSRIYCSRENIFPRKYLLAKISSRENIFPRKYPPAKIFSRDFYSLRYDTFLSSKTINCRTN